MSDIEWPEMTEHQVAYCEELFEAFRKKLKKIGNETLGELYTDILPHVNHDTFFNFKNHCLSSVKGYATKATLCQHDYTGLEIRNEIYRNHKEELISLLNQDLLSRIKTLEDDLKRERAYNSQRHFP